MQAVCGAGLKHSGWRGAMVEGMVEEENIWADLRFSVNRQTIWER